MQFIPDIPSEKNLITHFCFPFSKKKIKKKPKQNPLKKDCKTKFLGIDESRQEMEFYNSSRIRTILKLLCGRAFSIGSVRNTRSLDRVKNSSSPHGCELLSYSAQILQCELRLAPGLKQQVKVTEEHRRC